MKSFKTVSKKQENNMLAEQQVARDKERAQIVAAIKKEYSVNDFSKVSKEERASYKAMINEMWNPNEGITLAGWKFLGESAAPLNSKMTMDQIEKYFKKKVKSNAAKCVAKLIAGEPCDLILNLKKEILTKTNQKIPDNKFKKWVFDVCGRFLGESVKNADMGAGSVNEGWREVVLGATMGASLLGGGNAYASNSDAQSDSEVRVEQTSGAESGYERRYGKKFNKEYDDSIRSNVRKLFANYNRDCKEYEFEMGWYAQDAKFRNEVLENVAIRGRYDNATYLVVLEDSFAEYDPDNYTENGSFVLDWLKSVNKLIQRKGGNVDDFMLIKYGKRKGHDTYIVVYKPKFEKVAERMDPPQSVIRRYDSRHKKVTEGLKQDNKKGKINESEEQKPHKIEIFAGAIWFDPDDKKHGFGWNWNKQSFVDTGNYKIELWDEAVRRTRLKRFDDVAAGAIASYFCLYGAGTPWNVFRGGDIKCQEIEFPYINYSEVDKFKPSYVDDKEFRQTIEHYNKWYWGGEKVDEGLKQAALGAAMGLSVLGGMQSCSTPIDRNAAIEQVQEDGWAYEDFSGGTYEASSCQIQMRKYIVSLQINQQRYYNLTHDKERGLNLGSWGSGSKNDTDGCPYYIGSDHEGDMIIDYYRDDNTVAGKYDPGCYIAVYYTKNERESLNDRVKYIKVFHDYDDRDETEFTIDITTIKDNNDGWYQIY